MDNITVTYSVKIKILYKHVTKEFVKEFTSNIENEFLYDNVHIIRDAQYVLDLFSDEVSAWLIFMGTTMDNIIIDEYEITSLTDRTDVYFENPDDPNSFTLSPCIKCYVYPKHDEIKTSELQGNAIDQGSIRWTWEDDGYTHLLVSHPYGSDEEENKKYTIADLAIGCTEYIETGLEPNTSYTRRLIAYTPEQTSFPSGACTVMTETVNPSYSLDKYFINREQDWTIQNNERNYIREHLEAFHPGIGDGLDCKVYKQFPDDFYEKFKGYFVLKGTYTKREKRYEQVGFRYKLILEAIETIEEQEGDITFKLTAYPWQEVYCNEYLWAVLPVNVYAKVFATVQVYKKEATVYTDTFTTAERKWTETDEFKIHYCKPMYIVFCIDASGSMEGERFKKLANSINDILSSIENIISKSTFKKPYPRFSIICYSSVARVVTVDRKNSSNRTKYLTLKEVQWFFKKRKGIELTQGSNGIYLTETADIANGGHTTKIAYRIKNKKEADDVSTNIDTDIIIQDDIKDIGHCTNWTAGLLGASNVINDWNTNRKKESSSVYYKKKTMLFFFSDGFPNAISNKECISDNGNYISAVKGRLPGSIAIEDFPNAGSGHNVPENYIQYGEYCPEVLYNICEYCSGITKAFDYAYAMLTNNSDSKAMESLGANQGFFNAIYDILQRNKNKNTYISYTQTVPGYYNKTNTANATFNSSNNKVTLKTKKVLNFFGDKENTDEDAEDRVWIGADGKTEKEWKEFFKKMMVGVEINVEKEHYTIPPMTVTVDLPVNSYYAENITIESELLKYTFDESVTPVSYNAVSKRAEIENVIPTTKMLTAYGELKSVRRLLDEALIATISTNPKLAGYKPSEIKDEAGNVIGSAFQNIYIKDTYGYTDGNDNDITGFDSGTGWEYGRIGTVNTFTNIAFTAVTTETNEDDIYIALDDSYVWIDGYCDGIIYDGTRYGHANVCAYYKCAPQVTMFSKTDIPDLLRNRIAKKLTYPGPVDSSHVFKKQLLLKTPDPNYTVFSGDGIDSDLAVSINTFWESPRLEYRFNLLDPNAYTQFFEILPDAYKESSDKHCIVMDVYKADNIMVYSDKYISAFDCENPVQPPMVLEYGINSTWDSSRGIYDCDGKYIQEYVYFHSLPMLKTREYKDVLPPEGQDLYYGLVNGRFREDNPEGKQDLIVQVPQFNIPTSVLATHSDSIKIYIEISEFQPKDALVEYFWHNESPKGSGYTKVNGDYITFTCDSPTMVDIEHEDIISTIQTGYMELFDQKPYEVIQQIERPVLEDEKSYIKDYAFESFETKSTGSSKNATGITINPAGCLIGPEETLRIGQYGVFLKGENLSSLTITVTDKDSLEIPCDTSFTPDGKEFTIRFSTYMKHEGVDINITNTGAIDVVINKYSFGRTSGFYEHYYLEGYTDNGDVMVAKCPHEIIFDNNNLCEVPVTYQGIINATSRWAPRVHNGHYYFNQHEHFLYAETIMDADFVKTVDTKYGEATVFILFKVILEKDGGPVENYEINKDTRPELLQNEAKFEWVDAKPEKPILYGLTLKPTIQGDDLNNDGKVYKHYDARTWESPIIGFPRTLTSAGALTVNYINSDGSTTGLDFVIRAYDTENSCWPSWDEAEPFINGSVPSKLSAGYQLKCTLSATESHSDLFWDDYLCCYLDWCDYLDEYISYNINTSTDHITVGPLERPGRAVSKILDFACGTGMEISMYQNGTASLQVSYSNEYNDLLMENITWVPAAAVNKEMKYRYWRFKIEIPYDTNIYWVHLDVKTQYTDAVVPYIRSIKMTGTHEPEDKHVEFTNLESFTIPADGEAHEVISKISRYIESDIIEKGFERNDIKKLEITCRDKSSTLVYDEKLTKDNPGSFIDLPIYAAVTEEFINITDESPFINVNDDGEVVIKGTPQQYCPITVEDKDGNTYVEIFNVPWSSLVLTETYDITEENNYVTLKRTDFDIDTIKVWINDIEIKDYSIINHIVMFKKNYKPEDKITISYNVKYSFMAKIDRDAGMTTIKTYPVTDILKVSFETGLRNNKYRTKLSMNPVYRTEYYGFIYMTKDHNEPYKINLYCNPKRIKAGSVETVDISAEVLDVLDNPVVNKEIAFDCKHGTIECENYVTDINGVVHVVYRSSFSASDDTVTAKALKDDLTNVSESITIRNY